MFDSRWILGGLFLLGAQAHAYVGAISSATAEAGRASVEATDVPFLNPAGLAYLKGYYFTTGFAASSNSESVRGQDFALTLTDNMKDTVVPTSLAYNQQKVDFASEDQVTRDFRLGFGNFLIPHTALGIGLRYKDDQVPTNRYNQMNLNVGAMYTPRSDLGFAVVAENLLGQDTSVPPELRVLPSTSVGISYIYKRVIRTRVDVTTDSSNSIGRPLLGAGVENYMNRWSVIRLGIQRRNEVGATAYTAGIGFVGPKFGFHYAYLTSPQEDSLTRHSVDLAIPLW